MLYYTAPDEYAATEWAGNYIMNQIKLKQLLKRWLPTLLILIILAAWTLTWCIIVSHNTKVKVTEQLTAEYEQQLQDKIYELTYIPEDEVKNQAIAQLADYLDELIAGYSMNSNINTEGQYAIGWCFIARLMTGGFFGSTEEEVLNKPQQWQYYSPDNPVREQDTEIARAVATDYYNKHFPNDFTTNLCYAELKADGTVVLRDEFYTTSNTTFWKYKMGS